MQHEKLVKLKKLAERGKKAFCHTVLSEMNKGKKMCIWF